MVLSSVRYAAPLISASFLRNGIRRLYKRFDYLQDFPCELRGCLIDEASYFGTLETNEFLGFVMAYKIEQIKHAGKLSWKLQKT